MATRERIRQETPTSFGSEQIARQAEQGWKLVAVEWEREILESEAPVVASQEVPFGLQVAKDATRLEPNPEELKILFLIMELAIHDRRYPAIADELNRRGYRTRQGMKWTPISIFRMLPRLIEVGPRIFATQEWQDHRARLLRTET